MGAGSKGAFVFAGYKGSEKLALTHRPLGGAPHNGIQVPAKMGTEKFRAVPERAKNIGSAFTEFKADQGQDQLFGELLAAFNVCQTH